MCLSSVGPDFGDFDFMALMLDRNEPDEPEFISSVCTLCCSDTTELLRVLLFCSRRAVLLFCLHVHVHVETCRNFLPVLASTGRKAGGCHCHFRRQQSTGGLF